MWRYKRVIKLALIMSVVYLIYAFLFQKTAASHQCSVETIIFSNYTSQFLFSLVMFSIVGNDKNPDLVLYRFKRVDDYQKYSFISDVLNIMLFFVIVTLTQVLVHIMIHHDCHMFGLFVRNGICLYVMCFVAFLLNYIIVKKRKILLICLYILWNFEMVMMLHRADSILATINIFVLCQKLNVATLLRYISVNIVLICAVRLIWDKSKKDVIKWLR